MFACRNNGDRLQQSLLAALLGLCFWQAGPLRTAAAGEPFRVHVVDEADGWPVPLVELRTTHNVVFVTDNAGNIAIDLPEVMNRETWFSVSADGYEAPADGFGYRGFRLVPRAGEVVELKVKRTMLARRLGRLTGAGIYGESQQLGLHRDWRETGVFGCDSIQLAAYRGKLFWAWGDTTIAKYPLGVFHSTGATTDLQPLRRAEPPIKLAYEYFADSEQQPCGIAEMPGRGPTWLTGLTVVEDLQAEEKLVACYTKIEPPLKSYEEGLCVWDDQAQAFQPWRVLWNETSGQARPEHLPTGHAVRWTDDEGKDWLLFGDPFPALKCEPTLAAWEDPTSWQPLQPQETVKSVTGRAVRPHRGSIAWNEKRGKWVTVFCEQGGESSYLGEIWYAEADSPLGPWEHAVKVVTHDHYTFYNPLLHPELCPEGADYILFEATYTHTFSKAKEITPRYDYNQVLYRLELNESQSDGK